VIELRRIPDLWRRLDVTVRDLPLALLLAGATFLPAFHGHETQMGDLPTHPFDGLSFVALVLLCHPLAGRRRWPGATLALVSLGFVVAELGSRNMFAGTGLPLALLSAGVHLERHRRATLIVLSVAYAGLAAEIARLGSTEGLTGFVTFYGGLVTAWAAGAWVRRTRAVEAERRRLVAEATRTAERTRIARELHDVVTHHVTAMVVQSEAARYLTGSPDRLEQTLTAVTDTGRQAITDLRHLLDLLNPDHGTEARAPSAGELRTLVEQTRRAGQPIEFKEDGKPAESPGTPEFVAYRVVQESLTHGLKYAHGSRTLVHVHYGEREITLEVSTDGSGSPVRSPGGSGRGLAGLRERVEALGGRFSADRQADGGFVVRARIPAGGPA
jgi:signal transduction histidine kinase